MKGRIRVGAAVAVLAAAMVTVTLLALAGGASGSVGEPPPPGGNICFDCNPPTQCEDGRDNDSDGKIDYPADPGCTGTEDPDEADNTGGSPPPPPSPPGGSYTQCSDGWDNDADGLTDMNDVTGCTSPSDNNEGDDVYDVSGSHEFSFGRRDEGVSVDGRGGCAWLAGFRKRSGKGGYFWKFNVAAHFCWNGSVVTRIDNVQRWVDTIGFPWSVAYDIRWNMEAETTGQTGITPTTVFKQARFRVCPTRISLCLTDDHPWIRFVMFGSGAALCQTDTGPISARDCRS